MNLRTAGSSTARSADTLDHRRRGLAPLVIATVAALVFAILLVLVRLQWAPLESADHGAAADINSLIAGNATLVAVVKAVTWLGSGGVVWTVIGAATVILGLRRQWRLRRTVRHRRGRADPDPIIQSCRPARPVVAHRIAHGTGNSFPSGHSLGSIVCYGAILLVFLPPPRRGKDVVGARGGGGGGCPAARARPDRQRVGRAGAARGRRCAARVGPAIAYLRRALAEPPPLNLRDEVQRELRLTETSAQSWGSVVALSSVRGSRRRRLKGDRPRRCAGTPRPALVALGGPPLLGVLVGRRTSPLGALELLALLSGVDLVGAGSPPRRATARYSPRRPDVALGPGEAHDVALGLVEPQLGRVEHAEQRLVVGEDADRAHPGARRDHLDLVVEDLALGREDFRDELLAILTLESSPSDSSPESRPAAAPRPSLVLPSARRPSSSCAGPACGPSPSSPETTSSIEPLSRNAPSPVSRRGCPRGPP